MFCIKTHLTGSPKYCKTCLSAFGGSLQAELKPYMMAHNILEKCHLHRTYGSPKFQTRYSYKIFNNYSMSARWI